MAAALTITPTPLPRTVQAPASTDAVAGTSPHDNPGPSMPAGLAVAALGECHTGLVIKGTDLCTHGTDPVPDWIKKRGGPRQVQPTAVGSVAAVGCDGDGVSGKRVQALYVYVGGRANRLS